MNVGAICEALSLASGSVSYHLRTLEAAGLVERARHPEDGRTSWWRAVGTAMSVPGEDAQEEPAATGEYLEAVSDTYRELYGRYLAARGSLPREWRDNALNEDWALCLSVEELAAMNAELDAVAQRWRHLAQGREEDGDHRRIALVMQTFPWLP